MAKTTDLNLLHVRTVNLDLIAYFGESQSCTVYSKFNLTLSKKAYSRINLDCNNSQAIVLKMWWIYVPYPSNVFDQSDGVSLPFLHLIRTIVLHMFTYIFTYFCDIH